MTQLAVQSAVFRVSHGGRFVALTLTDGTESRIYLDDGSPRFELHEMLDEWIAAGNQISQPLE